jgi:hypothetical protein
MVFYIYYFTKENPLMTIGDAIASFLDKRDVTTKEIQLDNSRGRYRPSASSWQGPYSRWKHAASQMRRKSVLVLWVFPFAHFVL